MSATWKPNTAVEGLLQAAAERGAEAMAQVLLDGAVENTPVATGRLVGSAHVVGSDVVYDDSSTIAAAVHEDLTAHHANGSAKFLERAMHEKQGQMLEAGAAPLRDAIGG